MSCPFSRGEGTLQSFCFPNNFLDFRRRTWDNESVRNMIPSLTPLYKEKTHEKTIC